MICLSEVGMWKNETSRIRNRWEKMIIGDNDDVMFPCQLQEIIFEVGKLKVV